MWKGFKAFLEASGRWRALYFSITVMLFAGSTYAIGIYSESMKQKLDFTQSEMNLISSSANLGLYFSITSGFFLQKFGPFYSALMASFLTALGYSLFYLGYEEKVPNSEYIMAIFAFIWGQGAALFDVTTISVCLANFPKARGLIGAILKAPMGLSASLISVVYSNCFQGEAHKLLLFLTVAIPCIGIIAAFNLAGNFKKRYELPLKSREVGKIMISYCLILLMGIIMALVCILQNSDALPVGPVMLLTCLPFIIFNWFLAIPEKKKKVEFDEESALTTSLLQDGDVKADSASSIPVKGRSSPSFSESLGEEAITLFRINEEKPPLYTPGGVSTFVGALSLDYFLLLVIMFVGCGTGLTVINNIGSIVNALHGDDTDQATFVALLAVANCLGRIVFGACSDMFAARFKRPFWLGLSCLSSAGAIAVLAGGKSLGILWVVVPWAGFSYGGFWSISAALVADRMGSRAFNALYTTSNISVAAASFAFSKFLFSLFYEKHVQPGDVHCYGPSCYNTASIIMTVACMIGAASAFWLNYRMKRFYKEDGSAIEDVSIVGLHESRASPVALGIAKVGRALACSPGIKASFQRIIDEDEGYAALYPHEAKILAKKKKEEVDNEAAYSPSEVGEPTLGHYNSEGMVSDTGSGE